MESNCGDDVTTQWGKFGENNVVFMGKISNSKVNSIKLRARPVGTI
jgi:hypothetical protein